jgi:hypothetical protein
MRLYQIGHATSNPNPWSLLLCAPSAGWFFNSARHRSFVLTVWPYDQFEASGGWLLDDLVVTTDMPIVIDGRARRAQLG